jgi:hypothetical protein
MTSSGESIPSDSATSEQTTDTPGSDDDSLAADRRTESDDGTAADEQPASVFDDIDGWVDGECDLPSDVVFEILKNQRRRLVLQYLRETEGPARLGTLAEHIAAFENGVSPTGLNAQQRKRVYIGLYQCHLPKMADAGVVDFDQDRGIVEMNDDGESLLAFLDADAEAQESPRPYLLAVAAGAAAFLLSRLLFPPWASDVVVVALLATVTVVAVTRETES